MRHLGGFLTLAVAATLLRPFPAEAQGAIEIRSNTRVDGSLSEGKMSLVLADVRFRPDDGAGWTDRYFLNAGVDEQASLSVVSVICQAGRLLGYKGFNQRLSELSGSFSIGEFLATGSITPLMLARAHPWLLTSRDPVSGFERRHDPAAICGEAFRATRQDVNLLKTPKGSSGIFSWEYQDGRRRLELRWARPSRPNPGG